VEEDNMVHPFNRYNARTAMDTHNMQHMQQLQSLVEEHEQRHAALSMTLSGIAATLFSSRGVTADSAKLQHLLMRLTVCGRLEDDVELAVQSSSSATLTSISAATAMVEMDEVTSSSSSIL
jgi:hypothetical protein